jgi:hypothetical protein
LDCGVNFFEAVISSSLAFLGCRSGALLCVIHVGAAQNKSLSPNKSTCGKIDKGERNERKEELTVTDNLRGILGSG